MVQDPVAVLLRVDHPDDLVDQAEQPVDLERWLRSTESKSGRSSRTSPRRAASSSPSSALSRMNRCRGSTPTQSSSRLAGSSGPQTQACATPVVGRRTPDRRQLEPGQRVEQAGLAAAGAAGQRDHGVVARTAKAGCRPVRPACARRPGRRPAGTDRSPRRNLASAFSRSTSRSASTRPSSPVQRAAHATDETHFVPPWRPPGRGTDPVAAERELFARGFARRRRRCAA